MLEIYLGKNLGNKNKHNMKELQIKFSKILSVDFHVQCKLQQVLYYRMYKKCSDCKMGFSRYQCEKFLRSVGLCHMM